MNATYTQRVTFGVSNGPQYSGQKSVPVSGSDTVRNYPGTNIPHGTTVTIDAIGFLIANFLAMGFSAAPDATQTGTPTSGDLEAATITINLLHSASPPFVIVLKAGESVSWVENPDPSVFLSSDVSSIEVVGDSVVDVDVFGLLMLTA